METFMTLHSIRTITPVVVVLVAAAGVAAQQANAPAVLAAPQVRQLLISNQPADHARLKAHFEALSAKYSADAARHAAFAGATAGIPRGVGAAASIHHNKLAANAKESATIVRELAAHHDRLAAGVASTAPRGSERFEQGAGAPATPTEKQLLDLAAKAQTPGEHAQLSEYYTTLAAGYGTDAREHRAMAQAYRGQNRPNLSAIAHCDRLVKLSEDSAKETQALASEHKKMAAGR
jgi:cell division septum initiation protein DivIVA